eukprot:15474243-Alexandrium_andersonii.AAC.1
MQPLRPAVEHPPASFCGRAARRSKRMHVLRSPGTTPLSKNNSTPRHQAMRSAGCSQYAKHRRGMTS